MSRVKLALNVVQDLRSLADSIEVFANALTEENSEEAGASPVTETASEEVITTERVRAVLAAKSKAGKRNEIRELITKYGANKLTDIDPARYQELLKESEGM